MQDLISPHFSLDICFRNTSEHALYQILPSSGERSETVLPRSSIERPMLDFVSFYSRCMMIPPIDHERLLYTEEKIQGIIGIMILLRKLPIEVEVLD